MSEWSDHYQHPDIIECAGLSIDFAARTIHALGRLLPVTAVSYSEFSPERPGSDRVATEAGRRVTEMIYKTPERIAAALARSIPEMPESLHFNLLCENGWWVEVAAYPAEDVLAYGAAGVTADNITDGDAGDLLALYAEVSLRPMYVPSMDLDDSPWGGLAPGSWDLVNR